MASKADKPWLSISVCDLLAKSEDFIKSSLDNLSEEEICEEILKQFNEEETEFDKKICELVSKEFKDEIEYEIDDLIKFKCDVNFSLDKQKIEEEISRRIFLGGSYQLLVKKLEEDVEELSEEMLQSNFNVGLIDQNNEIEGKLEKEKQKSLFNSQSDLDSLNTSFNFSNFDNFSSFGNLSNFGNFIYLEWEKFLGLIDKCGVQNPNLEERINSMNALTKLVNPQSIDKPSIEKLIPVLRDTLTSGNVTLSVACLKFYWKIFSSNSHSAIVELFLNLLDFVYNEYKSGEVKSNLIPLLDDGVYLKNDNCKILLMIFRVIHRFLMNFVRDWVRFPNKEVEFVVFKVLNLIQVGKVKLKSGRNRRTGSCKTREIYVSPFHILSILDPNVKWLKRWMKSSYGRSIILHKFPWMKLLNCLLTWLVDYFEGENVKKVKNATLKSEKVDKSDGNLTKNENYRQKSSIKLDLIEISEIFPRNKNNTQETDNTSTRSDKLNKIKSPKTKNFQKPPQSDLFQEIPLPKFQQELHSDSKLPPPSKLNPKKASSAITKFIPSPSQLETNLKFTYLTGTLQFSHCYSTLEFLGTFFQHEKNFQPKVQFPLNSSLSSSSSSNQFILYLSQNLYSTCTCNVYNHHKFCLGYCMANILANLIKSEIVSTPLMNNDVINNISLPLSLKSSSDVHLQMCCYLLTNLTENENCCQFIFRSNVVKLIVEFTLKLFDSCFLSEITVNFLNLCSKICENHSSVDVLLDSKFPEIFYSKLNVLKYTGNEDQYLKFVKPLAHFAATPIGLHKIEEIGALEDCVHCLVNNIHVENYLLLQLSQIPEGISTLARSKFFNSTVSTFWQECEDINNQIPLMGSVENIERIIESQIDELLPFISSFASISTLLDPSVSRVYNWPPTCLQDLLYCSVFGENFDRKEETIYNPERFENVCLRLLSGITCSLDSNILLQSWFKCQEKILQMQIVNSTEEQGRVIIDEASIIRHNILIKTCCVGGSNEKMAPVRSIPKVGSSSSFPILTDDQSSSYYLTPNSKEQAKKLKPSPLSSFIIDKESDELSGAVWSNLCLQVFKQSLSKYRNSGTTLFDTMSKCVQLQYSSLANSKNRISSPPLILNESKLSEKYKIGIELTLKYGRFLGVANEEVNFKNNITHFLLTYQHNWIKNSKLKELFPWFAVTVFLMSGGEVENSLNFFNHAFHLTHRPDWLWLALVQTEIDIKMGENGLIWNLLCHQIEELLIKELPCVYSAFKLGLASISNVCLTWIRNCFWNYLNWDEICNFVTLFTLSGPNCIVFYLIAIFSHLQDKILIKAQKNQLNRFLLEEPLNGFSLQNYIPYLNYLSEKYNSLVNNSFEKYLKYN